MSRIFFIADTHFGHRNILKYEQKYRPFSSIEEHDEELIEKWNTVVGEKDIVYHLGDIVFGRANLHTVSRLNGVVNLLMGNHDLFSAKEYLDNGINNIISASRFKQGVISHVPIHPNQFDERYKYNIHGHMHSNVVTMKNKDAWKAGPMHLNDERYISVSCEQINLTPILWDDLKIKHELEY